MRGDRVLADEHQVHPLCMHSGTEVVVTVSALPFDTRGDHEPQEPAMTGTRRRTVLRGLAAAAVALAALTPVACGGDGSVDSPQTDTAAWEAVDTGQTPAQVRALVGEPASIETGEGTGTGRPHDGECWNYEAQRQVCFAAEVADGTGPIVAELVVR